MITYGKNKQMRADKVHYDANGGATESEEAQLLDDLAKEKPEHLFVISHGWNNDETEADSLYDNFFTATENVWSHFPQLAPSAFLTLAVIWPARKFDENAFAAIAPAAFPRAAAAVSGSAAALLPNAIDTELRAQLSTLKEIANDPTADALLDHAIAQIPMLSVSQSAQDDFVHAIVNAFPGGPQESDPGLDDGLSHINSTPGHTVLATIAQTLSAHAGTPGVTFQGGAAQLGGSTGFNPLQLVRNAALALANVTTYWTMKERAGIVGRTGVAQTIAKALVAVPGLKVHLVGHSFGGRLVTAAANALTGGTPGHQAATMTLLQAAYSHYGMAHNYQPNVDGIYRSVLTSDKVRSEIQVTHSVHDLAVGLAYPIASALARQIGQGLFTNPWGGMGGDGAQATPESFDDTLRPVGQAYALLKAPATLRNLNGNAIIMSHGDVTHDEIAFTALRAVALS